MKSLLFALIATFTFQAQAQTTFVVKPAQTVKTVEGCSLNWAFQDVNDNGPIGSISWSGACTGNKAQGYGWVSKKGTKSAYFLEYQNGIIKSEGILQLDGGDLYAFSMAPGYKNVIGDITWCDRNAAKCDAAIAKMNAKIKDAPKASRRPEDVANNPSTGGSSGGSSGGSYGSLTALPADFARGSEGPFIAGCDANKMDEAFKRFSDKELPNGVGVCTSAKVTARIHYFVVTMIEKSCSPSNSAAADRRRLSLQTIDQALQTVDGSCMF